MAPYDSGNIRPIPTVGKLEHDKITLMLTASNVSNVSGASVEVLGCNDSAAKIVEGDCKALGLVHCEIKDCGPYYGIPSSNVDSSCSVNHSNLDKKKSVVKGTILACLCAINSIESSLGTIYE